MIETWGRPFVGTGMDWQRGAYPVLVESSMGNRVRVGWQESEDSA